MPKINNEKGENMIIFAHNDFLGESDQIYEIEISLDERPR